MNMVEAIIEHFTSTNTNIVPTEAHTFIDTAGFKTKTISCDKNHSHDSTMTIYRYDDKRRYIGESTVSNYGFSSEYSCLDSLTFSNKINYKEQMHNSIIRLKYINRTKYTYVNDTLTDVHSCRHRKAQVRCKTVYYNKAGHRTRTAHDKHYYNNKKQLYKVKRYTRTSLFYKTHSKKYSYYISHYFYDEAGLLKSVTDYSSFTKSSSTTNYTYRKRID